MTIQIPAPRGYLRCERGRRTIYHLEGYEAALQGLGFLDGEPRRQALEELTGRTPYPVHELEDGVRVLWKRCTRGGWMESLLGDRHLGVSRFLRELEVGSRARDGGVPVAMTLAVAIEVSPSGFKRVEMLTRLVPEARTLEDALADAHQGTLETELRHALLREVAREIRRFHGIGLLHGDLHLKNILWSSGEPEPQVTLIDVDPGADSPLQRGRTPGANVLRLFRSYVKGELKGRWKLPATDLYRFLEEYSRGEAPRIRDFWNRCARKRRGWERLRFRHMGSGAESRRSDS